jgi:hypothetical protein
MATIIKANVHLHVADLTLQEVEALRAKIQNFLDAESRAKLLTFAVTEEDDGQ